MTATTVQPGGRYDALDSLRGVCACMVVLFHIPSQGVIANLPVVRGGWMFVDFFFVLSGFVISASYGARLASGYPLSKYMFLRFGRIYPLHIAVLGLFVAMELVAVFLPGASSREAFTGNRSLPDLFVSIFLLQTFNPPGGLAWNNPSWSIGAEFWTYLVAGLIYVHAGRRRGLVVALLIAASGLWLATTPKHLAHDADWGILRCFYGFGLGIVAHAALPRVEGLVDRMSVGAASALEILLATLSVWLVGEAGTSMATMAAPPLFLLVVAVFAVERGIATRVLLTAPMRVLGLLSYSIYMVHVFVIGRSLDVLRVVSGKLGFDLVHVRPNGVKEIVIGSPVADLVLLALLGGVVCVAAVTYTLVEKPARNWSRAVVKRRESNAAAQA